MWLFMFSTADPSGRAVQGVGLGPLAFSAIVGSNLAVGMDVRLLLCVVR